MKPEPIYLGVTSRGVYPRTPGTAYRCFDNRAYKEPFDCLDAVRQFTLDNPSAVVVVVSFAIDTGLVVEGTYINGHTDVRHSIGVRHCQSAYVFACLKPITEYLDTICRANAEEEGNRGEV